MAKLSPYIFSEDARTQAEFYAQALKGEIELVKTFSEMPDVKEDMKDMVMYLVLRVGDQHYFMADMESVATAGCIELALEFSSEAEAKPCLTNYQQAERFLCHLKKCFGEQALAA